MDAEAPSLLVALAVSKVGCLLAGCCYGQLYEGAWGVRYPFGSHAYVWRYEAGMVLVWYGLIRLVFDGFLDEPSRKLGLAGSQWMAIVIAVFGLVLCVMAGRRAAAGEVGAGS